jgi:hypothetical protein
MRGWAFFEVPDAVEEIELAAPAGVALRWVHLSGLPVGGDALARASAEWRWRQRGVSRRASSAGSPGPAHKR